MANEIRVSRTGAARLLGRALGVLSASTYHMRLGKNDVTPTEDSVVGDFTEGNYTGYAAQLVGAFGAAAQVAGRQTSTAPPLTFTATGSGVTNNIYTYYVTDDLDGALMWSQRFAGAPYAMDAADKSLAVTPTLTARSEFT